MKVIGVLNSAGPVCCDPDIMEIADMIEGEKNTKIACPQHIEFWMLYKTV